MKIIDLLNKIANGEEVPKKVKYYGVIFKNENGDLLNDINCSLFEHRGNEFEKLLPMLNDEVEILDDEDEEKKIPEKLNDFTISVGRVDDSNIEEYIQTLFEQQYEIFKKINSIIDYLKSKGE